jgi:hypothetical protein
VVRQATLTPGSVPPQPCASLTALLPEIILVSSEQRQRNCPNGRRPTIRLYTVRIMAEIRAALGGSRGGRVVTPETPLKRHADFTKGGHIMLTGALALKLGVPFFKGYKKLVRTF